jgi:hypothetical protein
MSGRRGYAGYEASKNESRAKGVGGMAMAVGFASL